MARIQPVDPNKADAKTVQLLEGVKKKLGMVPNLISTMANSTAVANAYLSFSTALAAGSLPAKLREKIALVVGETNRCDYCVAAHTALGKMAGLSVDETIDARRGRSTDEAERVALDFARKIVADRGQVIDSDIERLRDFGYDDGQIGEIVANVALNLFTNYFNHVAGTQVDFPAVPELAAV